MFEYTSTYKFRVNIEIQCLNIVMMDETLLLDLVTNSVLLLDMIDCTKNHLYNTIRIQMTLSCLVGQIFPE